MFDQQFAIKVSQVSKCYAIYGKPKDRLKQSFALGGKKYYREFWALKDVSFEIKKGEAVGIIGRNGSGKSTLLQMICGTLTPTSGEIEVNGRIAALLELGSGFNPEFTGHENVYLNGAILGLSKTQVDEKYDEIIAFADIGDFIHQPVKTYSSGMFVRLAFAVQACVEPDILIVDEALAVGDVFFRQKCYQRLNALREKGTAILLVTHGMGDVEQFCTRALLLDHGNPLFFGEATEAVKRYYLVEQKTRETNIPAARITEASDTHYFSSDAKFSWPEVEAFLSISQIPQISNGWAHCTQVAVCDVNGKRRSQYNQGEMAHFFYEFELLTDIETPVAGITLQNDKGVIVHGKNTLQFDTLVPAHVKKGTRIRFCHEIKLDIAWGEYTFEVGFASISQQSYQNRYSYSHEQLDSHVIRICHLPKGGYFSVIPAIMLTHTSLLHHGIADLPGNLSAQLLA